MSNDEITPQQREILAILGEGRATPGYIAERTGRENSNIINQLNDLVDRGLVEKVHHGLYGKAEDDVYGDPLRYAEPGSWMDCQVVTNDGYERKLGIVDKELRAFEITEDNFIRRARDEDGEPIGDLPEWVDPEDEDEVFERPKIP